MKHKILFNIIVLLLMASITAAYSLPTYGSLNLTQERSTSFKQGELLVCFNDPASGEQPASGPVIAGPRTRKAIRNIISDYIVSGSVVEKEFDNAKKGLAVIKLPENTSVVDAFIQFNLSANVRYAEPNYKYKLLSSSPETISAFIKTYNAINTCQTTETAAGETQAELSDVIVAVTDTGIDYRHPELAPNIWINEAEKDGLPDVDDDKNGYIDDVYGYDFAGKAATDRTDGDSDPIDSYYHGTHIAGIINTTGSDAKIKIMDLKIFADDYSLEQSVFVSDAIEAIGYAVNNGAKIINASWGGSTYSQALYDSIKDAGDAGLLLVAAAGNGYGNNNDLNPVYPASFDLNNIISVMSTNGDNQMAEFSNFGSTSVDIASPGADITSTTPTYQTAAMLAGKIPTSHASLSGTSMSAAYTSAQCAVIMSQNPAISAQSVKSLLITTADQILASPRLNLSGGIANLQMALMGAPSTRPGKILNTRYSPADIAHLYSTIQSAINDANDGDILIAEAARAYKENINFKGKSITLRSGNINDLNDIQTSPSNTYISGEFHSGTSTVIFHSSEGRNTILDGFTIGWGSSNYGGGISCENSSPTIKNCIISNNSAKYYGGGIDCYNASPAIIGCTITNNTTSDATSIGAGINCEQASPEIINCKIAYNFANNVGGAIACYYSNPQITNCLITNNSSTYISGSIHLEYSSPNISNCTILADDNNIVKTGGIFALLNSSPVVTNCILWGNGDDLKNCLASYSCIEDGDMGQGNIKTDPKFLEGALGKYYLTQTAAGQLSNSTCLNAGNPGINPDLQTSVYTTSTDAITDDGVIDIGYHYPSMPAPLLQLTTNEVIDGIIITPDLADVSQGRIEPNSGVFRKQEVIQLRAYPNPNYKLLQWSGTDDDTIIGLTNTVTMTGNKTVNVEFTEIPLYELRTEVIGGSGTITPLLRRGQYYPEGTVITLTAKPDNNYIVDNWTGTDNDALWKNTNTITMTSNKSVSVSFRKPQMIYVHGTGSTSSISSAVDAAYTHGDTIVVYPGTYSGSIDFQGKAITITSENPDDPNCVADTIIYSNGLNSHAFIFENGEGNDSVINGFTIQGYGDTGIFGPSTGQGQGTNGEDSFGQAVYCAGGSSPTIMNLVIRDCMTRGQDGEDASYTFDPPDQPDQAADANDPNAALDPPGDPNEDPSDPNAAVNGIDGVDGVDGLPGAAGADGAEGEPGYDGGDAGSAYGGAMYFDANSAPIIINCKMINCMVIGGDGGYGGLGQDGQAGQGGQPGQNGQDGQDGGEGLNEGTQGAGGAGGAGGEGGPGGAGGKAGDGGQGGDGGTAYGGAIYFGKNCQPTIIGCQIISCLTKQGIGNYGGDGGVGGTGGEGAAGGEGGASGAGQPEGAEGAAGAGSEAGAGGPGGIGGEMGYNGDSSVAGAIYFSENCQVIMKDTVISNNQAIDDPKITGSAGGAGGAGGDGGEQGDGTAGGAGGDGGVGGDGNPQGSGGAGGAGAGGGAGGTQGQNGSNATSSTSSYGGANYYEANCIVTLINCSINYNKSENDTGGGEYYASDSYIFIQDCNYIGNIASGNGGAQYLSGNSILDIKHSNYSTNTSSNGGAISVGSNSIITIADSNFISNEASDSGGAILTQECEINIENSHVRKNEAFYGGGLLSQNDIMEISTSVIQDNTAKYGGGLMSGFSTTHLIGNNIIGNKAIAETENIQDTLEEYDLEQQYPIANFLYGGGGGVFSWSCDAIIENCFISNNTSLSSGGGIYFGGNSDTQILKNSLLKGNTAVIQGGGIASNWYAVPVISNCTFVENKAFDPANLTRGKGGAISCGYGSTTNLIDSILWYNTATKGSQIAVGSLENTAALKVSYCDVQGGKDDVYKGTKHDLDWVQNTNINKEPVFTTGYGTYYLDSSSPCIDAGSNLAANLGLSGYSTRADGTLDTGKVDLGIHYPASERQYQLTVNVVGSQGTVTPGSGSFNKYSVVTLTATIKPGYRVRWSGTDDDSSFALTNTVTMSSDRIVTVRIEQPATIRVPENYRNLQDAINAAGDKDVIVISPGTYKPKTMITITGKNITITSTNPNDPVIVANTIIDFEGNDGIVFTSDCKADTILNGITITNATSSGGTPTPPQDDDYGANGNDGSEASYPGAITVQNSASPTILNCVITNCTTTGGNGTYAIAGADSNDTTNEPPYAGDGGNGGYGTNAYAGGIYCGYQSYPTIINCTISNCQVTGGNGGEGAAAGSGGSASGLRGDGGKAGDAFGGGIYVANRSYPTIRDCNITNCTVTGGNGGDGAGIDSNDSGTGGYGADNGKAYGAGIYFADESIVELYNSRVTNCTAITGQAGDGGSGGGSQSGEYWKQTARGGGIYCAPNSNIKINKCQINDNTLTAGMSGNYGVNQTNISYVIPVHGAGVFCDTGSSTNFLSTEILRNIAPSDANDSNDPNVSAYRLDPYISYGGGIAAINAKSIIINTCRIADNAAAVGGGTYNEKTETTITDSVFTANDAFRGAGISCLDSTLLNITGSEFTENDANDPSGQGQGGGIYCSSVPAKIADSYIHDNTATKSGAGLYITGDTMSPKITNCLIIRNSAGYDGGGISVNWYADPIISNCTIVNNSATSFGGGISSLFESNTKLINSILWNNTSLNGNQIALGSIRNMNGPALMNYTAELTISYSNIEGGKDDIHIEPDQILNWLQGNIDADPLFTGSYLLSQIAAGQKGNSPCVDTGSDLAVNLGMGNYSTRSDGGNDTGIVDMGYHRTKGTKQYNVTITIDGPGTVSPGSGMYYENTELTFIAAPQSGYGVQGWYDENSTLLSSSSKLTIKINSDIKITVKFAARKVVNVSGGEDALVSAVIGASKNDILVVAAGTYDGNINFSGKNITIVSTNPDDPDVVAGTIIDCSQNDDSGGENTGRAFTFDNGEGPDSIINGITIINGDANDGFGSGIFVGPDCSPTIMNVIIRDCNATESGGGVYIDSDASPELINCTITNCSAINGGGIYCNVYSTATLKACNISNNTATSTDPNQSPSGGGLYCNSVGNMNIIDCNFSENSAENGGGFRLTSDARVVFDNCLFTNNTATENGGAGVWGQADILLNNCNISSNTALRGGGLWYANSTNAEITRCLIFNNSAGPTVDPNDPNDPNMLTAGQGGGIYSSSASAAISDCMIKNNYAYTSGGGIYIIGVSDSPQIINNLIESNVAGRDGGGISVNWQANAILASCTFVSNTAPGIFANANGKGYGGALYTSYNSVCTVTNCIFWNDVASNGPEIAVASGFVYDPRPSTLNISYSDIRLSTNSIWVEKGCTLIKGSGIIDKDPLFVSNLLGNYYLSQRVSGQASDSPCVNAGTGPSNQLGLIGYTTRSDQKPDIGIIDIGFHYPIDQQCTLCDLQTDGTIDSDDITRFYELLDSKQPCSETNAWCHGADFNFDGVVDANDEEFMTAFLAAECWLVEDNKAPLPNPSLWDIEPRLISGTAVSMSAKESLDAWFGYWGIDVEYYFDCVFGNCHDSGWINSRSYTDNGLAPNAQYGYRVRVRDAFPNIPDDGTNEPGNKTDWSPIRYAGAPDTTPPAPIPAIISTVSEVNSISLTASVSYDTSGVVEYFFESLSKSLGGHDSGWITEPNYTDPNLTPATEYSYRVRARDAYGNPTAWSNEIKVRTSTPTDKTPPTPNPMTWDYTADVNGLPHEVLDANSANVYVEMTAATATDDSGGTVYYEFQCIKESGFSSGLITDNTYSVYVGRQGQLQRFRVRAIDGNGNPTGWSDAITALTLDQVTAWENGDLTLEEILNANK